MKDEAFFKTRLRAKGQLTIPARVRQLLGAEEGDDLVFYTNEQGQLVVEAAQTIPPDQAWFWTERWQKMEREAKAEIDAGREVEFDDVEEAIRALNSDAED